MFGSKRPFIFMGMTGRQWAMIIITAALVASSRMLGIRNTPQPSVMIQALSADAEAIGVVVQSRFKLPVWHIDQIGHHMQSMDDDQVIWQLFAALVTSFWSNTRWTSTHTTWEHRVPPGSTSPVLVVDAVPADDVTLGLGAAVYVACPFAAAWHDWPGLCTLVARLEPKCAEPLVMFGSSTSTRLLTWHRDVHVCCLQ